MIPKGRFKKILPSIFYVEISLGCNLSCSECALGTDLIDRKKGHMSLETYKKIADKLRPYAKRVYVYIWGEPTLNKDLIEMIKYTKEFAEVGISSNGNLIDADMAEKIIAAGTDDIRIAIDGTTQEVYEKLRVGGSLEKAFDSLRHLVHFRDKYESNAKIVGQFIVFKHNQDQIEDFEAKCKEIGAESALITPIFVSNNLEESSLPEFKRVRCDNLTSVHNAIKDCELRHRLVIFSDGTVGPCCFDYNAKGRMGNILNQEVLTIWNSKRCRDFRWNIMNGGVPDFCLKECLRFIKGDGIKKLVQKKNQKKESKKRSPKKRNPKKGIQKTQG